MRNYKPRIEMYPDKRGEWRFRIVASNGKIIAASEGYTTKRNAKVGARGLIRALKRPVLIEYNGGFERW